MLYTDLDERVSPDYDPNRETREFYEDVMDSMDEIVYRLDKINRLIQNEISRKYLD